ncbi:hypothetical protein SPFM20_00283 [Salmonella phage SPFM20]|nr:hypothetical protein SPFM8_00282 [Salmonella phage SPFM8]VFR14961.1 hypothetical protein SPFM20_00283 [Salmonella phage SPFM20]
MVEELTNLTGFAGLIESLYPLAAQGSPEQHQAAFGAAVSLVTDGLSVDQFAKETSVDTTFSTMVDLLQEDTLEPLGNWELRDFYQRFAFAYIIGVKTRDPREAALRVLEASNLEIDETQILFDVADIANQYSATRFYEHVTASACYRFAYR